MAVVPSPFDSEFDAAVAKGLDEWKVPGINIAVIRNGHTFSKVHTTCAVLIM